MTNIRDIAKESGYSVATVSRIVNNSGYASEKARKTVNSIIQKHNYKQNSIAQSLSLGKTKVIGLVIQDTVQGYYLKLMKGAVKESSELGYQLLILQSDYQQEKELSFLKMLQKKAIDGLIFTSHSLSLKKIMGYMKYGRIVICHDPKESTIAAVYTNRKNTYVKAFKWMRERKISKIGLALGRPREESYSTRMVLEAFNFVFSDLGCDALVKLNAITYEDGYKFGREFQNIEGILTSSDDVAAGMYQYFVDENKKVPVLVGQDCQTSGKILKLPSINHNLEKVGENAVKLLVSDENKKVLVKSSFEVDN